MKAFYDRFGARQDRQAFYEDRALEALLAHADLATASAVFELGCGTGRLAQEILSHHLGPSARLVATDVSETMVHLAAERLAPFGPRAEVVLARAGEAFPVPAAAVDRFVSTYVLDLMPEAGVARALQEAHRILVPGGKLCLVGITFGRSLASRLVLGVWEWIFRRRPSLVGGCRPGLLTRHVKLPDWRIEFDHVIVAWGVASEVLVATKAGRPETAA
ncbi:MAG: class I SAM-dependent methyltransferase [Hyphomicrobiales bacterium]